MMVFAEGASCYKIHIILAQTCPCIAVISEHLITHLSYIPDLHVLLALLLAYACHISLHNLLICSPAVSAA